MTQLTKSEPKKPTIRQHLESDAFRDQVAMALPKHVTPERFVRVALTATNRNPKLLQCTQSSLFQCLLDLSSMGLEPDGRRAHLIPFKDTCTLIIDYKGIVELAMRSGEVSAIHADKVCENDVFDYDKGQILAHKIDFRIPRGAAYAYYAVVKLKDGTEKVEVMTKEDVDAVRRRSRSANNGPWVTDYDEMAKKTVFRRASKWIPLSPEIRDAVDRDDDIAASPATVSKPLFSSPAVAEIEATEVEALPESGVVIQKATPREALTNLMKASHIEQKDLLLYLASEDAGEFNSVEEIDEQLVAHLAKTWHDIVEHITKGGQ